MAAEGDAFVGTALNVAKGTYVDIRPGVGEEVSLAYIIHSKSGAFYFYDGTNLIGPASDDLQNCVRGEGYRLTNSLWGRFKNTYTSSQSICWSGVYTKA